MLVNNNDHRKWKYLFAAPSFSHFSQLMPFPIQFSFSLFETKPFNFGWYLWRRLHFNPFSKEVSAMMKMHPSKKVKIPWNFRVPRTSRGYWSNPRLFSWHDGLYKRPCTLFPKYEAKIMLDLTSKLQDETYYRIYFQFATRNKNNILFN